MPVKWPLEADGQWRTSGSANLAMRLSVEQ